MILASTPWKRELARYARDLRRIKKMKRIGDPARAKLEQCCMIGFYIARKLTEAFQPVKIGALCLPVLTFKSTSESYPYLVLA